MTTIPADFSLLKGETPVWYGRVSWKRMWLSVALGVLVVLGGPVGFMLGLLFFLNVFLTVLSSEYLVTNYRVYTKYGLVGRRTSEAKREWITGTTVVQGFMGRILNYGDVIFSTPGYYAGAVEMRGVSDPMHVKVLIQGSFQGPGNYGMPLQRETRARAASSLEVPKAGSRCRSCGAWNKEESNYCENCGASLK